MIKGKTFNWIGQDDWNCLLFNVDSLFRIYRNKRVKVKRYELCHGGRYYFNTFKEAVTEAIKIIKRQNDFNKYIPDIMRLTALISEEDK